MSVLPKRSLQLGKSKPSPTLHPLEPLSDVSSPVYRLLPCRSVPRCRKPPGLPGTWLKWGFRAATVRYQARAGSGINKATGMNNVLVILQRSDVAALIWMYGNVSVIRIVLVISIIRLFRFRGYIWHAGNVVGYLLRRTSKILPCVDRLRHAHNGQNSRCGEEIRSPESKVVNCIST